MAHRFMSLTAGKHCLLTALMGMISAVPGIAAHAQSSASSITNSGVAWSAQQAQVDLATPDGQQQFGTLIQEAHDKTILYLDWTLFNAAQTEWGQEMATAVSQPPTEEVLCEIIERRSTEHAGLMISGKPDPQNHHLLFAMKVKSAADLLFSRARCEYMNGQMALRIRGFYYVTNMGTPTAHNLEFSPISMPAHVIPADLLKFLQ